MPSELAYGRQIFHTDVTVHVNTRVQIAEGMKADFRTAWKNDGFKVQTSLIMYNKDWEEIN